MLILFSKGLFCIKSAELKAKIEQILGTALSSEKPTQTI